MGSAQSLITSQNLLVAIFIAVSVVTVWRNYTHTNTGSASVPSDKTIGKKGKKKRSADKEQDTSVAASAKESPLAVAPNSSPSKQTVPGGIPELPADASPSNVSKPVKEKKRKGKKSGARLPSAAGPESSTPAAGPSRPPTGSESSQTPRDANQPSTQPPTAEPWTRVESRRKASGQNAATSDTGVTTATSVEEDESSTGAMEKTRDEETKQPQKTLAEKLLPKGRKTAVDDMLESPHYPELSRVIRAAPAPSEKPAVGFSWGDYEDVEDIRGADADADGEDDGGWGVVKSRGKAKHNQSSSSALTSPPQSKAPETLTKRQRQNSAKRAAEKTAKEDAEAARLVLLANHKRELERERIAEQFSHKGSGSTSRKVNGSGGIVNPGG